MLARMDWAERYAEENTPWDCGGPHPELVLRFDDLRLAAGARAFVPGCGRGHDALYLAERGLVVTAVDLVDSLAEQVAARLAPHGGTFLAGDALGLELAPFDLMFEHTFFCALDPAQRPAWGALAGRSVRPGGLLAALVFPGNRPLELGGPPWLTRTGDLAAALGPRFELETDEPAAQPVPRREWEERWAVFRRSLQP